MAAVAFSKQSEFGKVITYDKNYVCGFYCLDDFVCDYASVIVKYSWNICVTQSAGENTVTWE